VQGERPVCARPPRTMRAVTFLPLLVASCGFSGNVLAKPVLQPRQCQPALGGKDVRIVAADGSAEWTYASDNLGVDLAVSSVGTTSNDKFRFETNMKGAYWITASGPKSDFLAVMINSTLSTRLSFTFFSLQDQTENWDVQCNDCSATSTSLATGCSVLSFAGDCVGIDGNLLVPSTCSGASGQVF
ncbi:hypothetical protein DL96DRAFT_1625990, partial [Flagelloscypha sp. PMI_526]